MTSLGVNSPEFDAQKGGSNVSKRLNQIFEARLENDKETLEALNELSLFFKENTYQSRRNLRSEIEKRSLAINEDFLTAFRRVKVVLDSIYVDVSSMNSAVQNMSMQLQATKAQTRSLIGQTTKLQAESEKLSMEEEVARAFVRSFQLTPIEMAALRETNISNEFYRAMDHVQEIRGKCRMLMNCGHQKSALDIMDQMAMYQEAGMEQLYRWAQVNCRNIDSPDTSRLLAQAMSRLQDRPHLFNYVVSEYCTRRRAVVVQLFIDALTRGGPGGNPRPIEMHAHDVARYVGDMLAWLHQAIPSERDNLAVLLQGCDQPGHDAPDPIQEAVSNISECVCHPLRVRVEHILSSDTPVTSLYTTNHLLRFYLDIFSQVVPGSVLVRTLTELQETSERVFLNTLSGNVKQQLPEKSDPTPPDLSPPPSLVALFTLLREILSTATLAQGTEQDILKIVSTVVDPVLESVSLAASRLATTDMAVFLLNCFHHMQTMLALYPHMDDRLERLQAQSEAQLDTLTSEQASSLVANLNLGPIYTILQDQGKGPLSQIPGMEPTSLNNFLSKLETFLSMPEMLLLAQIGCLQSSIHRATVQRRATEVITAIYGQLYQCVHDKNNFYDNPDQLMPRTPEQIKQALLRS